MITLHAHDQKSWLETVWEALNGFREDCIPESEKSNDAQWDEITTAMSWINEALGNPDFEYLNQKNGTLDAWLQRECERRGIDINEEVKDWGGVFAIHFSGPEDFSEAEALEAFNRAVAFQNNSKGDPVPPSDRPSPRHGKPDDRVSEDYVKLGF